jgi:hypothetical protein
MAKSLQEVVQQPEPGRVEAQPKNANGLPKEGDLKVPLALPSMRMTPMFLVARNVKIKIEEVELPAIFLATMRKRTMAKKLGRKSERIKVQPQTRIMTTKRHKTMTKSKMLSQSTMKMAMRSFLKRKRTRERAKKTRKEAKMMTMLHTLKWRRPTTMMMTECLKGLPKTLLIF